MASPSARHWAGTRHTRPCHPGGSSLGASAGTCDFRILVCGPWPSPPGAMVISGVRGSPGQPREGTGGGQGGPSPRRTFRRARSLAGALGSACGAGGNTAGTARHAVRSVPASCADRALPKVTDAGAICGTRCGRQRAVADGRAGPTRYVAFGLRCVRTAPRAPSPTAVLGLRAAGRVAGGGIVRLPPASLPLPSHVRSRGHGFPVAAAPGRVLGVPAGPPYPRPGRHLRAEMARVTQGGILV